MELEEYLKHCHNPTALANFIAPNGAGDGISARLWDNFTVDVAVSSSIDLGKYLSEFKCPICSTQVGDIPCAPNDSIRGMFLTCPKCSQIYFVHELIPFGGTDVPIQ